jgi:sialic acid synthase SpsE
MKGGDHAASLEPQGLENLVRDIRALEEAMGSPNKVITEEEIKKLESLNLTRKDFNWC